MLAATEKCWSGGGCRSDSRLRGGSVDDGWFEASGTETNQAVDSKPATKGNSPPLEADDIAGIKTVSG